MLMAAAAEVEIRCPVPGSSPDSCKPGPLLAKLRRSGDRESYVHPDNLVELNCDSCRSRLRKAGRPVTRVLHRYDFAGTLITTLVEELYT